MAVIDSVQHLGQIFLPMSLNKDHEPHYFILDTGAGMSAVDKSLAANLALPKLGQTELAGTAGVLNVPLVQLDTIGPMRRVRPVPLLAQHNLVTTAQDLSQFKVPMPAKTPEAGLLGNDYLRHFVVEIEFLPPAVHLSRSTGAVPAGVEVNTYLKMWLDANQIMRVSGRLDGWLDVELRLDSGAATLQGLEPGPYLNLPTAVWNKLREKQPQYRFYTSLNASGMGGTVELNVGHINSLELGPLHFEQPSVVVQPAQGIFANDDAVGFISLNLFESGKWLTLDYEAGRIYLPEKLS